MISQNGIMYILLLIGVLFFWYLEHKDVHCPNFGASKEECDSKGGMSFSNTKPNDTDSCKTLISKIHKAAGAEQASVKWRRAMILSASIMTLMWVLITVIPKKHRGGAYLFGLPSWQTFYISTIIGFSVLLGSYLYYSYHVFGIAENWIRDSLKELEDKGCIVK